MIIDKKWVVLRNALTCLQVATALRVERVTWAPAALTPILQLVSHTSASIPHLIQGRIWHIDRGFISCSAQSLATGAQAQGQNSLPAQIMSIFPSESLFCFIHPKMKRCVNKEIWMNKDLTTEISLSCDIDAGFDRTKRHYTASSSPETSSTSVPVIIVVVIIVAGIISPVSSYWGSWTMAWYGYRQWCNGKFGTGERSKSSSPAIPSLLLPSLSLLSLPIPFLPYLILFFPSLALPSRPFSPLFP